MAEVGIAQQFHAVSYQGSSLALLLVLCFSIICLIFFSFILTRHAKQAEIFTNNI